MQFDTSCYAPENPEFWLILLTYIGFWGYSYYSLVILLIHTRKHNRSLENTSLNDSGKIPRGLELR